MRMNRITKCQKRVAAAGAIIVAAMAVSMPIAHAVDYNLEFITTWSSCEAACRGNQSLSYTDNQINMLDSRLQKLGSRRLSKYSNTDVWASDVSEDQLGGEDNLYSDNGEFYAYSGHGGAPVTPAGQTFVAPFCRVGTDALQGAGGTCQFNSQFARMGELSGMFAMPNTGRLRWLLWATCFSVHTDPFAQWRQAFSVGLDYIVGYRGTSADSSTTDEVPSDFANGVFGNTNSRFKGKWFSAAEDWWVDDVAAVAAPGATLFEAQGRRDNETASSPRRIPTIGGGLWVAWSWHEG